MEITVITQQSLFDIAVQAGGGVEAIFSLAQLNNISITDVLTAGTMLQGESIPKMPDIAAYYRVNALKPATGLTHENEALIKEGIDYWYVSEYVVQ